MTNDEFNNYHTTDYQSINSELKSLMLSQKIIDALKERQLSKMSFASLMGVQPSIITRWLSGKHNFTVETLFEIEERLNIKLLAIDLPKPNTISFHLKVKSNHASFDESKMFPGFTSINLKEDQLDALDNKFIDIDAYLTELRNKLNYDGK